jgi:YD repeat-containing protein
MKRISDIFCSMIIVYSGMMFGQNIPDYNEYSRQFSLSNPDVYTFEKYKLSPMNKYAGKQTVEVPIYTIKSRGIEYPLKLNYNAGGIKVDQLASDVGLGWSMSSAMITRVVMHDNDFDNLGAGSLRPDYNLYTQAEKDADWEAKPDYNTEYKVGYFLQKQNNIKIGKFSQYVDFMPDIYNVYIDGFTTTFFFNNENSPIEINPKGTKIEAIASTKRFNTRRVNFMGQVETTIPTRDFFTIIITTNKGIKYTFSDCDLSLNQTLLGNGWIGGDLEKAHGPAQVSAWHVTKIEDLNTGKKVDFVYEDSSSNPNQGTPNSVPFAKGAQRSFELDENPYINYSGNCGYYVPYLSSESFDKKIMARVDVVKKRLRKILFDDGQVYFNYNHEGIGGTGVGRNDIYNGDFLTQIYLKDKNLKTVKSFNLNYGIFTSDYNVGEFNPDGQFNSYRYNRLKLLSFQEVGMNPYKFTYEESIKLPPVNSFSVDFLGYYNNSQDITSYSAITGSVRPNPTLYYYPNKFEKSLLPFPIAGMQYTTIPGMFNRQANDYAKAWSLTKVEFPTGGSSEFIYESNEFEVFGQRVKGGGIRISKQLLNDGTGNTREVQYTYDKAVSGTSGTLPSMPYFGHPTKGFFPVTIDYYPQSGGPADVNSVYTPTPVGTGQDTDNWKLYDKGKLNADITTGSFVGYSRVIEKEQNNGYTESLFTSNDMAGFGNTFHRVIPQYSVNVFSLPIVGNCITQFIIANSGFGSQLFTDNSYKRGRPVDEKIFNESNVLIKNTHYDYTDVVIGNYNYAQGFFSPIYTQNDDDNTQGFMTVEKNYKINQFLPHKKTVTTYDGAGTVNIVEADLTYNSSGLTKTESTKDSQGNVKMNQFYYPTDVVTAASLPGGTLTSTELSAYLGMKSTGLNNVAEQIQVEDYVNSVKTATSRRTFKERSAPLGGGIFQETVKQSKASGTLFNKYTINKYEDGTSNPVEISEESGAKTVLIWGYKKTKLLAKIDNADYASIPATTIINLQTLSDADNDNCKDSTCKEQLLRNALEALRNSLPNAQMTSYTHDWLVGITSITNPRGHTNFYEYDVQGRLISIKDPEGKIISGYEYNFRQN